MSIFKFKFFDLKQSDSPMKVGTDAMLLGAFANVEGKESGLDIGSGTGVISLMCAQRNELLSIKAVELDELGYKECDFNFKSSSYSSRLKVYHFDFLVFKTNSKFDFIISNPPYYQSRLENSDSRKSKARHESSLPKASFMRKVSELLAAKGELWIIVPFEDVKGWVDSASKSGMHLNQVINIKGKVAGDNVRAILMFSGVELEVKTKDFVIRETDGSYTEEYIELTKEFHYKSLKKKEA